jgi:hypothetical protein
MAEKDGGGRTAEIALRTADPKEEVVSGQRCSESGAHAGLMEIGQWACRGLARPWRTAPHAVSDHATAKGESLSREKSKSAMKS